MAQCYLTALREARETRNALAVIRDVPKGDPTEVRWLHGESDEFVAMLDVSVRKLQRPAEEEE